MAFFSCDRTCCVSVLLGPMAHFAVPCVVFLPDMHVLIVTYHAPTPEAADVLVWSTQSELHAFNVFVQCVPSLLGKLKR